MLRTPRGFTLIELLIVVGILAVLATVVILVINPSELFKQARDIRRLNDTKTLTTMVTYAKFAGKELGPAGLKRVDVSVPGVAYACNTLSGSDTMAASWVRRCAPVTDYLFMNGTGWLELNMSDPFSSSYGENYLAAVTPYGYGGALVAKLPIDPTNDGPTGLYYMYLHDAARYDSFEIVTTFESAKYQAKATDDGGYDSGRYETGGDLILWKEAAGL